MMATYSGSAITDIITWRGHAYHLQTPDYPLSRCITWRIIESSLKPTHIQSGESLGVPLDGPMIAFKARGPQIACRLPFRIGQRIPRRIHRIPNRIGFDRLEFSFLGQTIHLEEAVKHGQVIRTHGNTLNHGHASSICQSGRVAARSASYSCNGTDFSGRITPCLELSGTNARPGANGSCWKRPDPVLKQ